METTLRAPSLCPFKKNITLSAQCRCLRVGGVWFYLLCNTAYPKLLALPNLAYEDWLCRGVI